MKIPRPVMVDGELVPKTEQGIFVQSSNLVANAAEGRPRGLYPTRRIVPFTKQNEKMRKSQKMDESDPERNVSLAPQNRTTAH